MQKESRYLVNLKHNESIKTGSVLHLDYSMPFFENFIVILAHTLLDIFSVVPNYFDVHLISLKLKFGVSFFYLPKVNITTEISH